MEIQGTTAIDTLFEFAGYAHGYRLAEHLVLNGVLVGLVIAGGFLRLYYMGFQRDSYIGLVGYPIYILVITFLVWPVPVSITHELPPEAGEGPKPGDGLRTTVKIPRVAAFVHPLTDGLVASMVEQIEPDFKETAFSWMRVSAVNAAARVHDADLEEQVQVYLYSCYLPAVDQLKLPSNWNFLPLLDDEALYQSPQTKDFTYPEDAGLDLPRPPAPAGTSSGHPGIYAGYTMPAAPQQPLPPLPPPPPPPDFSCGNARPHLRALVERHLRTADVHKQALSAYKAADKADGRVDHAEYFSFYFRRVMYNETFKGPNEVSTVRRAVPEFSIWNGRQQGHDMRKIWDQNPWGIAKTWWSWLTGTVSAGMTAWDLEAMGPSTYYQFSELAPYLYGLISGILVMGFPIAALLSYWPGCWTAILNFFKIFVSVKLWPIWWAWLSSMNAERGRFSANDPTGFEGTFGSAEMFAALAGMYLLTPVLSFYLVSLGVQAGNMGLGALVGRGQTGSGVAGGVAGGLAQKAAGSLGA